MKPTETFYTSDRQVWRRWLTEHFESAAEIWFVFPTKDAAEESLSYNDAVEEALCFGWIDGQAWALDDTHQLRRFTPRRKGSPYSQPNIERLLWLDAHGLIHPKVRDTVADVLNTPFVFPKDILDELRRDETVWNNYNAFPEPYRRIRVAYVAAARNRPEEFAKRLASFIDKTRRNKLIAGYGGIEKYYGAPPEKKER